MSAPVPANIKAARNRAQLTQAALAQRLNVTVRAVKHWEAGTRRMPYAAWLLLQQWADIS